MGTNVEPFSGKEILNFRNGENNKGSFFPVCEYYGFDALCVAGLLQMSCSIKKFMANE